MQREKQEEERKKIWINIGNLALEREGGRKAGKGIRASYS